MQDLGMGTTLWILSGGSPKDVKEFYGRKIKSAELVTGNDSDAIVLKFDDGTGMRLWDDARSCCESRYMTCDDDLSKLVGGKLTSVQAKHGPLNEGEYGETHEQVFIEIGTDECFVTLCTHNEHNGYYGGFGLSVDDL